MTRQSTAKAKEPHPRDGAHFNKELTPPASGQFDIAHYTNDPMKRKRAVQHVMQELSAFYEDDEAKLLNVASTIERLGKLDDEQALIVSYTLGVTEGSA